MMSFETDARLLWQVVQMVCHSAESSSFLEVGRLQEYRQFKHEVEQDTLEQHLLLPIFCCVSGPNGSLNQCTVFQSGFFWR